MKEEFKNLLPLLFTKTYIKTLNKDKFLNKRIKEIFMGNPARLQDRINQGAAIIEHHDTRNLLHKIETAYVKSLPYMDRKVRELALKTIILEK